MTGPRWSLGVLVGLPIAALCALSLAVVLIIGIRMLRSPSRDDRDWAVLQACFSGALLVVVVVVTGFVMWPWDVRFHQWRPVSGTVQQTSSRLIPVGDRGVEQRIVLLIAGKPYGCDDTRCALLQPGDTVHLACKPEYQLAGEAGEGCEFLSSSRTDG